MTSLRANAKQSTRMIKVWIASSRSLSSGAHSRDPLAHRNYESGANHAMKNLLTDISGIRVGHADNPRVASGATAVIFDKPAVAAIDVRGGGPGIREGALLDLANTVERIDALVLAIGSASAATPTGVRVAALAVVNAVGSVTVGDGPWFWAAPFEIDGEYGGRGLPASFTPDMLSMRIKGAAAATSVENTTLAIVVTDAELTKPQAKRLAMIAQTGFARAIYPVHTPLDGDVLFAAATCEKPVDPLVGLTELGMVAANVVARAIARGVHAATALPFPGALPAWKDRFG